MSDIHTCSYHCHMPECIRAQRDELRDRLAAAEADAERYRWLRERGDDCQWQNILRVEVDDFSSLDAAIDKARGAGDE